MNTNNFKSTDKETADKSRIKYWLTVIFAPIAVYLAAYILITENLDENWIQNYPLFSINNILIILWMTTLIICSIYFKKRILLKNRDATTEDTAWVLLTFSMSVPIAYFLTKGESKNIEMLVLQETMALTIGMVAIFISRLIPQFNSFDEKIESLEKITNDTSSSFAIIADNTKNDFDTIKKEVEDYFVNLIDKSEESHDKSFLSSIIWLKRSTHRYLSNLKIEGDLDVLNESEEMFKNRRKKINQVFRDINNSFDKENDDVNLYKNEDSFLRAISIFSLFTSYFKYEDVIFSDDALSGAASLSTSFEHYAETITRMIKNLSLINKSKKAEFTYEFYIITDRSPVVWYQQTKPQEFENSTMHPGMTKEWQNFLLTINDDEISPNLYLYFSSIINKRKNDLDWPLDKNKLNNLLDTVFAVCNSGESEPIWFADDLDAEEIQGCTAKQFSEELATKAEKELTETLGKDIRKLNQCQPKYITFKAKNSQKNDELNISGNQYCLKSMRKIFSEKKHKVAIRYFSSDTDLNDDQHFKNLPKNIFAVRKVFKKTTRSVEQRDPEWKLIVGAQGRYSSQSAVKLYYSNHKRGGLQISNKERIGWSSLNALLNEIFLVNHPNKDGSLDILNPSKSHKKNTIKEILNI